MNAAWRMFNEGDAACSAVVTGASLASSLDARGDPIKIVSTILTKGSDVGAVIMLGTLLGLIVLVVVLVLRFDPEARGPSEAEDANVG
jgi:hypothetical protein